jgi:hypothetical protein
MSNYLYQIDEDADSLEEAKNTGNSCFVAIVDETYFEKNECLDDDHILDSIILTTNRPDILNHLDELVESMFASNLEPNKLREFLNETGYFTEQKLF